MKSRMHFSFYTQDFLRPWNFVSVQKSEAVMCKPGAVVGTGKGRQRHTTRAAVKVDGRVRTPRPNRRGFRLKSSLQVGIILQPGREPRL